VAELPQCSGKEAIRAFSKLGYRETRQKGSHVFLKCEGRRSISVPLHKTLAKGTLRTLIRDAGITVEEFIGIL
jgi:predicted RNA binding protein YcfA (HicA-like mRNA interferase family)